MSPLLALDIVRHVPLRQCISDDPSEVVVFGVDILAQPHFRNESFRFDPHIYTKCARALPAAHSDDIVVLMGRLENEYYQWLRGYGLGPAHVVEYGATDAQVPLAQLILKDPDPVREAIKSTGRRPVFVPYYSGSAEHEAARALHAEVFGCDESITLRYFNKESFKNECADLGISVIGGVAAKSGTNKPLSTAELAETVSTLLHHYPSLIIRGTEGSAGSSIFKLDPTNARDVYKKIRAQRETAVLVEPFLEVISSPNDQWVITRDGSICHLGISAQLFQGLKHVGNLQGQYFSSRIEEYIAETSWKIVTNMARLKYRGVVGIDYIVSDGGIFPVENNARMNGSSFTLAIIDNLAARHGPIPCWKFFKASTTPCSYSDLISKINSIVYQGKGINCVFPYDCDTLPINGIFAPILVAEDMYHIEYLEKALEQFGITKI